MFYSDDPVNWEGTNLYFQGFRILKAVTDEILDIAGDDLEEVILSGCSGS